MMDDPNGKLNPEATTSESPRRFSFDGTEMHQKPPIEM